MEKIESDINLFLILLTACKNSGDEIVYCGGNLDNVLNTGVYFSLIFGPKKVSLQEIGNELNTSWGQYVPSNEYSVVNSTTISQRSDHFVLDRQLYIRADLRVIKDNLYRILDIVDRKESAVIQNGMETLLKEAAAC